MVSSHMVPRTVIMTPRQLRSHRHTLRRQAVLRGGRKGLGDYARNGDRSGLQRSLKHYVKQGYGGAKTTTARFGGTVAVAAMLNGTLPSVAEGSSQTNANPIDPVLLNGRSASALSMAARSKSCKSKTMLGYYA
jgi:hypothetical protein